MSYKSRARLVAVTFVVLAVVAIAATAGGAVADDHNETATNETDGNDTVDISALEENEPEENYDSGPYSRAELTRGGQQVAGGDPSMRWIEDGSIFIDYPSADPLSPSAEEWEVENVLGPQALVERDEITINAQRERGASSAEYTLTVVHWVGDHHVDDNGSVHQIATDQSVSEYVVQFDGPMDRETVDLPNTDGDRYQVTMWLEDDSGEPVEGARWTFAHESAPTSLDAGIQTQGDLYSWVGLWLVGPLLFGIPASLYGGRKILNKTGRGTDIPTIVYGSVAMVFAFGVALFGWKEAALIITNFPLVIPLALTAIAFVAYLEYGSNDIVRAQFIREELMDATSPSGEDVHDVLYQEIADMRLVRTDDDGRYVIVESGIMPFLARLFGVAPTLDVSDLSTQIKATGDKWDKIFVADPSAPSPIEYSAPSMHFPLSDPTGPDANWLDRLSAVNWSIFVMAGLGAAVGWLFGGLLGVPMLGLVTGSVVGFLVKAASVESGHAEFAAAPVHYTQARQTLAASQTEYEDAKTLEEMETIAWQERARTALDARKVQSNMDKTVTQQLAEDELGIDDEAGDDDRDDQDEQSETDTRDSRRESNETAMVPIDD